MFICLGVGVLQVTSRGFREPISSKGLFSKLVYGGQMKRRQHESLCTTTHYDDDKKSNILNVCCWWMEVWANSLRFCIYEWYSILWIVLRVFSAGVTGSKAQHLAKRKRRWRRLLNNRRFWVWNNSLYEFNWYQGIVLLSHGM